MFMFYLLLILFFILQYGSTPLYGAAQGGHLSILQLLLSVHADVNQANKVTLFYFLAFKSFYFIF